VMIQLARALRISPRAQLSARSARTLAAAGPTPWEE
jgi:hypothetical protein